MRSVPKKGLNPISSPRALRTTRTPATSKTVPHTTPDSRCGIVATPLSRFLRTATSFLRKHDASRTYSMPASENSILLRWWVNLHRVLRLLARSALTPKLAGGRCLEDRQPTQQKRQDAEGDERGDRHRQGDERTAENRHNQSADAHAAHVAQPEGVVSEEVEDDTAQGNARERGCAFRSWTDDNLPGGALASPIGGIFF